MPRLSLSLLVALIGLLVPASALAAKPPAAVVGKPTIAKVQVLRSGTPEQIDVRVVVRHPGFGEAAPGAQAVGTVTVILSRYRGERDYTIAGGSDAWALPVSGEPLTAAYQVRLGAAQARAVVAASGEGALRALVLVDARAKARGRAPARSSAFDQRSARVAQAAQAPVALPPLLAKGAHRVVIDLDASGRPLVRAVEIPLGGGRALTLAPRVAVPADGQPVALTGRLVVRGPDGAELAALEAPAGFSLAVSPTGRQRGTLVWPAFEVPGVVAVPAGTALLAPPPTRG